jgi:hypothetical protein
MIRAVECSFVDVVIVACIAEMEHRWNTGHEWEKGLGCRGSPFRMETYWFMPPHVPPILRECQPVASAGVCLSPLESKLR